MDSDFDRFSAIWPTLSAENRALILALAESLKAKDR